MGMAVVVAVVLALSGSLALLLPRRSGGGTASRGVRPGLPKPLPRWRRKNGRRWVQA